MAEQRKVDLYLAPLGEPLPDGRLISAQGPWLVRAGGAPIVDEAGTVVGALEQVSDTDGWLVGRGLIDTSCDLTGLAPQVDLRGGEVTVRDGWWVFLHGRVDQVVLGTGPTAAGARIVEADR